MMLPFTHPSYVVQCLFSSVEHTVKAEGCLNVQIALLYN